MVQGRSLDALRDDRGRGAGHHPGNAASLLESGTAAQKRFLGIDNEAGKALGLDPKWAYQTVAAVGNYGEIFERHLGKESALRIDRGLNKLWNNGGLIYAPPVR